MITLPGTNGVFEVDVPADSEGVAFHRLLFIMPVAFTAGALKVEMQRGAQWVPVPEMNAMALAAPRSVSFTGLVGRLRFTVVGASGGGTFYAVLDSAASWLDPGVPDGAFVGLRALTVQPYTEANVKNGVQYYLRAVWPLADTIAAGTSRKLWFKTGAKQVLVKLRDVQYIAEELIIRLYAGPTGVTGGTALGVSNYNGVNPVPTTAQAKKNVTTTANGTEFGGSDPEYFFGSANAPQRAATSIPQGRERVLPANTEFIVDIANTGTGVARVQYYLDWYEGGSDLPRPA